ncbi:MAG TPA: FAD-dependent monooxygenase [Hyphomicrobiales bacterium]|nr:FAD-dependent monooxygenase [Hyphomicrobiales bacterium]
MDSEVIIVGAGPVGLTLAIDLGRRGVRTTLIERKAAPEFLPKMERCNARTMEIYRRMGLAARIRAAGLPADVPMDVFVVLTLARPPLLHLPYPSVAAARERIAAVNDGTMPAEPYQLISQYTLEPLLKEVAEGLPAVAVRYGTEFVSLTQDAEGVTATVVAGGSRETLRGRYLVGCDGGASPVRKSLGIALQGDGSLMELQQALFRCDGLFERIPVGDGPGKGRHYHVADDHAGFLIMQDSTKHFTFHATLKTAEEMRRRFEEVIALPLPYEMLSCNPWRQNLLLADRYRDGRVFLAGDAVHLVTPSGGLGMNTGVGDAVDLGWKLAAVLRGWGGDGLLSSYEVERRQVGERNVGASRYATVGRRTWRAAWRPEITDETPAGQAARDNLSRIADIEQRKTNEMIGAELGYRYRGSQVIAEEEGGPDQPLMAYSPTIWPGARLPHVRLADGRPIQDLIPAEGYTLLRLGGAQAETGLVAAFGHYGAPLAQLDIAEEAPREIYGYDLILLRPDLHVAWRGNLAPDDPAALAAKVTGHL